VLVAKSARLEVRQLRAAAQDVVGGGGGGGTADTFPVMLQLPINGRLTALEALKVPSLPTAAVFMLQDRYQYAVVSYCPPQQPFAVPTDAIPGQIPKVSPYPVYTHASGSLLEG
jgi:hypothetical protein